MAMDKKHILFVVVLIFLVVSIVYRAYNPFEQTRVETLTFTGEQRLSTHSISLEENPTHVHDTVSRFMDPPLVSASVHQNLFSTYQPPRVTSVSNAPPKSPLDALPIEDPEQERRDLIQDAMEEISAYKIFGKIEEENRTSVFFFKDNRIIIAGKGDFLEEKYRIDEIEKTHITIMALHLNESIHLDTSEFFNK
jgi:hypothetical protein